MLALSIVNSKSTFLNFACLPLLIRCVFFFVNLKDQLEERIGNWASTKQRCYRTQTLHRWFIKHSAASKTKLGNQSLGKPGWMYVSGHAARIFQMGLALGLPRMIAHSSLLMQSYKSWSWGLVTSVILCWPLKDSPHWRLWLIQAWNSVPNMVMC